MSNKILLVDDEINILDSLRLTLRKFTVITESDSIKALARVKDEEFAVVISDMRMPKMDGIELLRAISYESPNTVRIMLTGHGDMEVAMSAINTSGVFKFMTKPVEASQMRKTVNLALAEHEKLLAAASLKKAALHDELTNLPNRTLFMDRCKIAIANAKRDKTSLALFFIDLDGFKYINDTFGHDAGDQTLKTTSQRFVNRLRKNDTAARYGGDEFIILLSGVTSRKSTRTLAETLVNLIAAPIIWQDKKLKVGASLGIGFFPEHGDTIERVMTAADSAMYKAKKQGGGCVMIADT